MNYKLIAPLLERKMKVRCDYCEKWISFYGLTVEGGFVCYLCWDVIQ